MTEGLIYTVVGRKKKTILCEYTQFSGNFQQISLKIINQLNLYDSNQKEFKIWVQYDQYMFYCYVNQNIFLIAMAGEKKTISEGSNFQNCDTSGFFFAYLYRLYQLLIATYTQEKLNNCYSYSLKEFVEVIKEMNNQFNINKASFSYIYDKARNVPICFLKDSKTDSTVKVTILLQEKCKQGDNPKVKEVNDKQYLIKPSNVFCKSDKLLENYEKVSSVNKRKSRFRRGVCWAFLFTFLFLLLVSAGGLLIYFYASNSD